MNSGQQSWLVIHRSKDGVERLTNVVGRFIFESTRLK